MLQASGSEDGDGDAEAARLEAEHDARQRALNEEQAALEASIAGKPELLRLLRPFPKDMCACHRAAAPARRAPCLVVSCRVQLSLIRVA